jgi:hypothetical protein
LEYSEWNQSVQLFFVMVLARHIGCVETTVVSIASSFPHSPRGEQGDREDDSSNDEKDTHNEIAIHSCPPHPL